MWKLQIRKQSINEKREQVSKNIPSNGSERSKDIRSCIQRILSQKVRRSNNTQTHESANINCKEISKFSVLFTKEQRTVCTDEIGKKNEIKYVKNESEILSY